ncbi:WD40 repeat-like protein [Xylographa carneopallida]|nr:WD40 repeat-like protein [Xylographa carneopallida]
MSLITAFQRPLAMIAEARLICRSFSTYTPLRADYPYQSQSPHRSLLELDTKKQEQLNKTFDTLATYSKPEKRDRVKDVRAQLGDLEKRERSRDLERMQVRRWKVGNVYAPHDLSPAEMKKWRQKTRPDRDVFDALAINPIDHYMVNALFNHDTMETVANLGPELLNDVRVHDFDGTDKAPEGYRPSKGQSAKNCKGDTKSNRHGVDAECACASRNAEKRPEMNKLNTEVAALNS